VREEAGASKAVANLAILEGLPGQGSIQAVAL